MDKNTNEIQQIFEDILDVHKDIIELEKKKRELAAQIIKMGIPENKLIIQNLDGSWTRATILDNVERIDSGYYEMTRIERFSLKVEHLKNKPKELKELHISVAQVSGE